MHVDLVGPLPTTPSGKTHFVTMVDKFTRWVEAVPLSHISAKSCADAVLHAWVSRYGVPVEMVSDLVTQFESALFNEMLARL